MHKKAAGSGDGPAPTPERNAAKASKSAARKPESEAAPAAPPKKPPKTGKVSPSGEVERIGEDSCISLVCCWMWLV